MLNFVKLVKSGLAHEDQCDKMLEFKIIILLILIVQIPVYVTYLSVIFEGQASLPKHLPFGIMLILPSKDLMDKKVFYQMAFVALFYLPNIR